MALKPTDVRVPLSVQLILDCHWLVCVRGERLTDRSIEITLFLVLVCRLCAEPMASLVPYHELVCFAQSVEPLVERVCDTDRLVCSKTCLNANDIAFVIDGSSSVGTGNFRTVLQFVANVTQEI